MRFDLLILKKKTIFIPSRVCFTQMQPSFTVMIDKVLFEDKNRFSLNVQPRPYPQSFMIENFFLFLQSVCEERNLCWKYNWVIVESNPN